MFAVGSPGSPFGSPKNTPVTNSPLRTPSPRSFLASSQSPKYSPSGSTPPQRGPPLTALKEKSEECLPPQSKTVPIKRRNSRRKLTGVDVSPDYATFRDRTQDDSLTRKLSLPQKEISQLSGKPLLKENPDAKLAIDTAVAVKNASLAADQNARRRRATSETITNRKFLLQDINLASLQTAQQQPLFESPKIRTLAEKSAGINRAQSSPALLSEVVKRLPLPFKSESDATSQSYSDLLRQIATESLASAALAKLSSPIFKVSDQLDSPQSEFGGSTPPNLFQISPHSWSELAELAVARERKISLTKRSISRTPSDTSERSERKTSGQGGGKKTVPHVTTCQGSKVTFGFDGSPNSQQFMRQESGGFNPTSGIDTHIGTVFLQPPDLPEETLMPNEHLKVMDLIESKTQYVKTIIRISQDTESLWSEAHDLFARISEDSKQRELETLLPIGGARALQEMALLSEAIKILLLIIEFSQRELEAGNLRPTKAMKTGMNYYFF